MKRLTDWRRQNRGRPEEGSDVLSLFVMDKESIKSGRRCKWPEFISRSWYKGYKARYLRSRCSYRTVPLFKRGSAVPQEPRVYSNRAAYSPYPSLAKSSTGIKRRDAELMQ